jgi:hypothetical protein
MPFMDSQSLLTILTVLLGSGLFLRMVAKEKRRREKYLEFRRFQKSQADTERRQRQEEAANREAAATAVPAAEIPMAELVEK